MKKVKAAILALVYAVGIMSALPMSKVGAAETAAIDYTADNGQSMCFRVIGEEMVKHGDFDSEADMDFFTTGGANSQVGSTMAASDKWRYNSEEQCVEALASEGSKYSGSLLTFIPLNDGEEIGEERWYCFSMRVKGSKEGIQKYSWTLTKSADFWSINSATVYGGRYPDYIGASSLVDSSSAIDNNAPIYVGTEWQTVGGLMKASPEAKYLMINGRYLNASESSPTYIDNIVCYQVEPLDAAAHLFLDDYIIYDSLPQIDGTWSDAAGYVQNGEYTRPYIGGIDTLTATYTNGTEESFLVEVLGSSVFAQDRTYKALSKNLLKNASFEYFCTDNRSDGKTYPFYPAWESTITGSDSAGINNAANGCYRAKLGSQVTGKAYMQGRYNDNYNNHASFNQKTILDEGLYYFSFYARKSGGGSYDMRARLNSADTHSFADTDLSGEWQKLSCVFEAKDGDEFEFTAANIADVCFDAFTLVSVEPEEAQYANVKVVYSDEQGEALAEEIHEGLTVGSPFEADEPVKKFGGEIYLYGEGEKAISAVSKEAEKNVIALTYVKAEDFAAKTPDIKTPERVAPELSEKITVTGGGKTLKVAVRWDEISPELYAQTGSFTVRGVIGEDIEVYARVNVVENYNYLEGRSSTADFSTEKTDVVSGGIAQITFDVLPLVNRIDGCIGFTSDAVTPDNWNKCAITVRMYTDGRFQYIDGGEFKWSNAFYSRNTAYSVKILADLDNATYSAYVSQKGADYGTVICENAAFRSDAPAISNIAKYWARGGSGYPEGQFITGNMEVRRADKLTLLRTFLNDSGEKTLDFAANADGESKLFFASYDSTALESVQVRSISYSKGDRIQVNFDDGNGRKLIAFDENLVPQAKSQILKENNPHGFTSSFMGSFAFYANQYDADIVDRDENIVQTNVIEMFSDRIVITTHNFGEKTGTLENPEPYVIHRENGDMTQTTSPLMRILVFGDYQIGQDLLTEAEDPIRPVFKKMCAEFAELDFDAVMIGGDLTWGKSVTKERWDYVVDKVLGYIRDNISPNIYIIAGNHDYNAGERDGFNSADYYNAYLKENLGSLEENSNGYFETFDYYDGDVLIAYCYEQDGVYFMGLSTSPDNMRGNLQYSNYIYSDGAMDWIEDKLESIGADKTVFFTAHFPLNNSNNIVKSVKGASTATTQRLVGIFKNYPNLLYLYGHDHGSAYAFIDSATAERVTQYDSEGYKMN